MGFISKFMASYTSKMWVRGITWAVIIVIGCLLTAIGAQAYLVRKYKKAFRRMSIENIHLQARLKAKDFQHARKLKEMKLKKLEAMGPQFAKERKKIQGDIAKIRKQSKVVTAQYKKKERKIEKMSLEELIANRQKLMSSTKDKPREKKK